MCLPCLHPLKFPPEKEEVGRLVILKQLSLNQYLESSMIMLGSSWWK